MKLVIEIPNSIYNTIESDEVISREQLMILQKHILDGTVIPQNPTNGDMIKFMFPDAQIDYHEKSEFVEEYITVYPKDCDTCQDYPKYWWNLPYKEEGEE